MFQVENAYLLKKKNINDQARKNINVKLIKNSLPRYNQTWLIKLINHTIAILTVMLINDITTHVANNNTYNNNC